MTSPAACKALERRQPRVTVAHRSPPSATPASRPAYPQVRPNEVVDVHVKGAVTKGSRIDDESTEGPTQKSPLITGSAPEPPLGSPSQARKVTCPRPTRPSAGDGVLGSVVAEPAAWRPSRRCLSTRRRSPRRRTSSHASQTSRNRRLPASAAMTENTTVTAVRRRRCSALLPNRTT
jgi:hypothetical protein